MAKDNDQPKKRTGGRGPRPQSRGLRPHLWISGPDPRAHKQYGAFLLHRAQANYRKEPHELTFEQWAEIWNKDGAWEKRGRSIECVCLARQDLTLPWSVDNVEILTRREQLARQSRVCSGGRARKTRKDKGTKRIYYKGQKG
jgi:hypothetical protein